MLLRMMKRVFLWFLIAACCCVTTVRAQISAPKRPYVNIVLTPTHDDWNYRMGEEARVTVRAYRNGVPLGDASVVYETGEEMMPADMRGEVRLDSRGTEISLGTMTKPGARRCVVRVKCDEGEYRDEVKVCFSPERIAPTVENPADFDDFWRAAVAGMRERPFSVEVTPLPEQSTATVEVALVKLVEVVPGRSLYGYLCTPRAEGRYPAVLVPPGAGVKGFGPSTALADEGFISLTVEIHGLSPQLDDATYRDVNRAFGDYMYRMAGRDDCYYKHVYLACVRAADYLCSLPAFDGEHLGVTGGSQGGALSIVTAALHERVRFLAAFYPALCDMTGYLHGRAGGWPHLFASKHLGRIDERAARETVPYYDVVNFARRLRVPGFYSFGYNDNTCPPTSVWAAVNSVTAPKEVVVMPITGHWRYPETNTRSVEWMKSLCSDAGPHAIASGRKP